jgi:hypothetical protein
MNATAFPTAAQVRDEADRRGRAKVFTRYARALCATGGRPAEAVNRIRSIWPRTRELDTLEQAMIPAHGTGNTAALIPQNIFAEAFLGETPSSEVRIWLCWIPHVRPRLIHRLRSLMARPPSRAAARTLRASRRTSPQ